MHTLNIIESSSPELRAVQIWKYYVFCNIGQTHFHTGLVKSLKYDVSTFNDDIGELISTIEESLNFIFAPSFENSDIEVFYTEPSPNYFKIKFEITLYKGTQIINLNREIDLIEGKIQMKNDIVEHYHKHMVNY